MSWQRVRLKLKFIRELVDATKKFAIVASASVLFCELIIYVIVLMQCSWPGEGREWKEKETLRAMLIADTHLLGPFRGHWFDKLRREWQMHRSFQTAMHLFEPEAVFFLGDLFDEGNWVDEDGFAEYVQRFHRLFSVEKGKTKSIVMTGNHDMGFHYEIIPYLQKRFNKAFKTKSVKLLRLKGSNFLLLNSMAMERDGCFLCSAAEKALLNISKTLECDENPFACPKKSSKDLHVFPYSAPILMQHFPMYRESDKDCIGEDTAPASEKNVKFREALDCLSKQSSELLFKLIKPRLILSGHTHHHCITEHDLVGKSVVEYSVPSFSWRNRNDPSFYLAVITPTEHHLSKCYLPKESSVINIYCFGAFVFLVWLLSPVIRPQVLWLRLFRRYTPLLE